MFSRFVFALLILCSFSAYADFQQGIEAVRRGQGEIAKFHWQPLAEEGHTRAQFSLGVLYYEGQLLKKDYAKAAKWFIKSADSGYAPAQFNLGNIYRLGRGREKNEKIAADWWHKAADQGYRKAQHNLATLYYFGQGVKEDKALAVRLYQAAAKTGYPPSMRSLKAIAPEIAAQYPDTLEQWLSRSSMKNRIHREDWLLAQDPEHYVIQLMSGTNPKDTHRFLKKQPLQNSDVSIFRFKKNGDQWHSLVYGVYDSYADAKATLDSIKPELRKKSPWIRSFAGIHKLIREYQSWQTSDQTD